MKTPIQGVKGARDFYPEDMAFRYWLYRKLGEVSRLFGYQEYDGPFLEKLELYAAKSGEELVKEQSFVFADRGGEYIALRPELTPSLARMVAARQNDLVFPLRWWSFGPFWRYERPQKGRSREFFQWNIDLMGVNSREADAEMLAIGCTLFQKVGLTSEQVVIAVNDRGLMETELTGLGIPADRLKDVYRLIDRREKMSPESWDTYAAELGLSQIQLDAIKDLMGNQELWKKSPSLSYIFDLLKGLNLLPYFQYDPSIIRGLDYYTGIVFEARDREGGRAIFGGGRYDNLVGDVGGQPTGGLGFAMGDVVIRLLLEKYNCLGDLPVIPAKVLVTLFNQDLVLPAIDAAAQLRNAGIRTEVYPEPAKLPKQFKYADRLKMRYILVLGPDEVSSGMVTVKDLQDGSQQTRPLAEVIALLA
jgi:histidyl-tRNA synthetase